MEGLPSFGRSAPDDIAVQLRSQINGGRLGPGDRLPNERELAAQLGVARPTLREAIRMLIGEGYLRSKRGNSGGTFVSDLAVPQLAWLDRVRRNPDQIVDLFEYRVAVERHAAGLAAEHHTDADISAMREAIAEGGEPASRRLFRQADHRFHVAIGLACGSPRLQAAIVRARGEVFLPVDTLSYQDHFAQNCREHESIVRAIERRDRGGAERAMSRHIKSALADLLDQVSSMDMPARPV